MYKTLPQNCRSLPLHVDGGEFSKEWLRCISDKESDLTELIEMMQPVFQHWKRKLLSIDMKDDINYLTLCRLLSPDSDKALKLIKNWIDWAEINSTIIEELEYLFVIRTRKFKYKPALARSSMIEYIVARDFKHGLYHHIRFANRLKERDALYHSESIENIEIAVEFDTPDYFLLDAIKNNEWDSYLFHLISQGYTSVERSTLTKIHRRNLYKEEKEIWDLAKQKLFDS